MPKEHQQKPKEKAPTSKPEPAAVGFELEPELEALGKISTPGALHELPPTLRPKQVKRLQRLSGNQSVQRALQTNIIQRQGGGGGNTAPIPKLSDHAARKALAIDVLKKAYGGRIKAETPVNTVESESALRGEYDRSMIAQGKEITIKDENGEEKTKKWENGDTHNHDDMKKSFSGFRDTSNNQIYIDTSKPPDEQTATIAHEMLHASSSGNFIATLGKGVDEGMTEKLTIDAFAKSGYSVNSGMFVEWVTYANRLCGAFGSSAMVSSYFSGTAALRDAINAKLGRGSYLRFTQAVQQGDWDTANDMILRGKTATIEAIFNSWWVTDEDISTIQEIYRNSYGDEKNQIRALIQANIPSLNSIGQRTQLRLLLAEG